MRSRVESRVHADDEFEVLGGALDRRAIFEDRARGVDRACQVRHEKCRPRFRTDGRFHVAYAYHLAPISAGHIDELELLLEEFGVAAFKIFMFYGGYSLHDRSSSQRDFLMIGRRAMTAARSL